MVDNPPEVRRVLSCAGTGDRTIQSKTASLPWHEFKFRLAADNQDRLLGRHSGGKRKDNTPLSMGRYLRRPDVKSSFYRITGSRTQQVATIPEQFHSLQTTQSEHVGIRLTAQETEDIELSRRQGSAMLSHQDWFLGTVRLLLEKVEAQPTLAASLIPKAKSLVLSAARAGMDLQTMNSNALYNIVLRRRDAFLATTDSTMDSVSKKELRRHDLDSPSLFAPAACDKVHRTLMDRATLKAAVSGGKKAAYTPPHKAKTAPKRQHQQQKGNQSSWSPSKAKSSPVRPWDKDKGKGSPGSNSSFQKKGGGGRGRGRGGGNHK